MPIQIESLYEFSYFFIYVERDTDLGTAVVKWWVDSEKEDGGFDFDTYLEITTTEAEIEAFKAGRITCRAFWRRAVGLTLTRDHPGPVGPQSKSVLFEDLEPYWPAESVLLKEN